MDAKVRRYNGEIKGARLNPPLQNRTSSPDAFSANDPAEFPEREKKLARADGLARANEPRCCCVVMANA
jgi:hypothetical protein